MHSDVKCNFQQILNTNHKFWTVTVTNKVLRHGSSPVLSPYKTNAKQWIYIVWWGCSTCKYYRNYTCTGIGNKEQSQWKNLLQPAGHPHQTYEFIILCNSMGSIFFMHLQVCLQYCSWYMKWKKDRFRVHESRKVLINDIVCWKLVKNQSCLTSVRGRLPLLFLHWICHCYKYKKIKT